MVKIRVQKVVVLTMLNLNFEMSGICLFLIVQKQPPEVFCKKDVLKNTNTDSNTLFSCEICKVFKNIYFDEHL